jgi:hypothetical protein
MSKKKDYGTASPEEISAGFALAAEIAKKIREVHNPAVQNMIKELIALIEVRP